MGCPARAVTNTEAIRWRDPSPTPSRNDQLIHETYDASSELQRTEIADEGLRLQHATTPRSEQKITSDKRWKAFLGRLISKPEARRGAAD